MSNLIRLENACVFITVISVYFIFDFSLWIFLVFLLVPDISMIGYAINKVIGSKLYNLGHTYVLPIIVALLYLITNEETMLQISLIWLAHISMDRTIGYGLKYAIGFDKTTIQKV
ncbi:DUF4260 domain-containing protein [Staphylococcus haemolyticus]|uniref:DUF4260 domain-containing protein n=1 Tax=Staphylococcus haemolyticus TaxID=1283 RepID=UPI0028A321B8|nr:DUF4260 domain-containing protein [Staphylococcus haemolyticus]MDT3948385.1 DUF4260 domain-containing protein [Staphylococcus haemolyticus]